MMEQYRVDENKGLELGLYTLGDHTTDALTGSSGVLLKRRALLACI
ncbi:hypothetical protein M2444_001225 [Paenibacillus sp. PastF-3]|nr:hypothetical protein [Paenibacillus sp. PastF-3]MDH6369447.1 hypothetical protein [Paenibacillus sp. PastF-3]